MQAVLIHAGRVMAVFRAELQPGDTPPDDPLFAVSGPGTSLVRCTALSAHQQLGQGVFGGVFALLRLSGFLHHFPFAGPPGHLLPHLIKHSFGDDGWVVSLDIDHGTISLIFLHRLADAVSGVGLLQQGIANVFFILYCQAGTKKKLKKLSKADINEKFQKEKVTTNYTLVSRECPNSPIKRCSTSA